MSRHRWIVGLLAAAACSSDDSATGDAVASSTSTSGVAEESGAAATTSFTSEGAESDSSTGAESPPQAPEFWCPNPEMPSCTSNEGPLRAGTAVRSIVPSCFESWVDDDGNATFDQGEQFLDCGCDRICPEDRGYDGPDEGEGDGEFQRVYIAGFQGNRLATGVRGEGQGLVGAGDGIDVRVVVLDQGDVRVALLAIDTVGVFRPDVARIRSALRDADADVDYVLVHALHNHEGPDTMGLWGPRPVESGYDPQGYGAQWRAAAVEATLSAIDALEPVNAVRVGAVDASADQPRGAANLIRDSRDPWIVDPTVSVVVLEGDRAEPIATLVNYGCHPETLASGNTLLTADFVHALRRTVEVGSTWRRAPGRGGVGGTAIVVNGAVGGMMTTLGVSVTNPDGDTFVEASFDKADSIGQILGEAALDAVAEALPVAEPRLRVFANTFSLPVENPLYIFGFNAGVIERDELTDDTPPQIRTEMAVIELGPLRWLTIPGELLPEIAIGGYDGSALFSDAVDLIDPENPVPPNLDAAPPGPYLLERLAAADAPRPWIVGLGNDELGYIVPDYDFVLADSMPYFNQAEGDHYEETNSLGPDTASLLETEADRLIEFANWDG